MTIKKIAELANVSISTVSKVVNKKDKDIGDETRQKVLKVIKKYNYKPYSRFFQNSEAKSGIIGIIVPRSIGRFAAYLAEVESVCAKNGCALMLCIAKTVDEIETQLDFLAAHNAEGAIIHIPTGASKAGLAPEILPPNMKIVLTSNFAIDGNLARAWCDYTQAGEIAIEKLLGLGHRDIAFVGDNKYEQAKTAFIKGYTKALYEKDILLNEAYIYTVGKDGKTDKTPEMASQIANTSITAVVCQNDESAVALAREFTRAGMRVPQEMSIVSLQGGALALCYQPRLSYMGMQQVEMGHWAANKLVALLEKYKQQASEPQVFTPVFCMGESTASPSDAIRRRGQKIVVVGSLNMDVIVRVPHIPTGGETLLASGTALVPGGKGGNQAVGIGRLGGDVSIIASLGNDSDGKLIYSSLADSSVKTDGISFDRKESTGKAYIHVAADGESTIVVYPGTNYRLKVQNINDNIALFDNAKYCLLTAEIPWETMQHSIFLCAEKKIKLLFKPSSKDIIPDNLLGKINYFIPNEKELHRQYPASKSIEEKAEHFVNKGVENVIVTLGGKGCYLCSRDTKRYFPAADFTAIDTTGASDAFISALAVYLSEGNSLVNAIKFATYCAGLSITREGVQPAMPERAALAIYMERIRGHWPKKLSADNEKMEAT